MRDARDLRIGALRSGGVMRYARAWLSPWQPVFRARTSSSGLDFFVHRRDVNGRHIAKYGSREPGLTAWICSRLDASPPGLFVDVGANMGWYAIHAAKYAAVRTVVAFEPDAFNNWLLDRNLTANGIERVVTVQAAVGATNGVTKLYRYKASNLGRHSTVVDHGFGSRLVPQVRCDDALAQLGLRDTPILVMKIDVEGSEPDVLAGATHALRHTSAIVFEYSPELSNSKKLATMREQLEGAGFNPSLLTDDGKQHSQSWSQIAALTAQTDIVAIRMDYRCDQERE